MVSKSNYFNMFMSKKLLYTSPEVDVFAVQTEGVVCQSVLGSGDYADPGSAGMDVDFGDLGLF